MSRLPNVVVMFMLQCCTFKYTESFIIQAQEKSILSYELIKIIFLVRQNSSN